MNNKTHWAFWLIAVLALLWNAEGIFNYMVQTKPEMVAKMPEAYQAIINGRPTWATGGFAVGVFAGALGSVMLLLKKPIAGLFFMISLLGIFVTMIHSLNIALAGNELSIAIIFQTILLPLVVANFLIGFTFYALKKNWMP